MLFSRSPRRPRRTPAGGSGAQARGPAGDFGTSRMFRSRPAHDLEPAWRGSQREADLLQALHVSSQLGSVSRADALVGKSVHGLLLWPAILNVVNKIGVRRLLHGGRRKLRRSHLLAGGGGFSIRAMAARALCFVKVFLRPRQAGKDQEQRESGK